MIYLVLQILKKHYDKLKFFKIDMVIFVKGKFWEASCIYSLTPEPSMNLDKSV